MILMLVSVNETIVQGNKVFVHKFILDPSKTTNKKLIASSFEIMSEERIMDIEIGKHYAFSYKLVDGSHKLSMSNEST